MISLIEDDSALTYRVSSAFLPCPEVSSSHPTGGSLTPPPCAQPRNPPPPLSQTYSSHEVDEEIIAVTYLRRSGEKVDVLCGRLRSYLSSENFSQRKRKQDFSSCVHAVDVDAEPSDPSLFKRRRTCSFLMSQAVPIRHNPSSSEAPASGASSPQPYYSQEPEAIAPMSDKDYPNEEELPTLPAQPILSGERLFSAQSSTLRGSSARWISMLESLQYSNGLVLASTKCKV
ncbi:hypothetical protein VNI00_019170 [Paramarasmius palmivorus]|uniref:Uncharacterized protein n=1 Tax=Paramarasmius palmivorus TaxID=297713 RepID=A0AAW0APZ6_9AGAR